MPMPEEINRQAVRNLVVKWRVGAPSGTLARPSAAHGDEIGSIESESVRVASMANEIAGCALGPNYR